MKKARKVQFFGIYMTTNQIEELKDLLKNDILDRYNHEEYWETDIISQFVHENKLNTGNSVI